MIYFGSDDTELFKAAHLGTANVEDKVVFFHNSDKECAAKYKVDDKPTMAFFRKFEEKQLNFHEPATVDAVKAWYNPRMVPTLFKFTDEEIETVFGKQQNTLILFRKEDDEDLAYATAFKAAAEANKGKMLFSYSDGTVPIQEKLAEFMGVTEKDMPTLRCIKPDKMVKYSYDTEDGSRKTSELTVESVTAWVNGLVDGTETPHLKSEPIPESNDAAVKVIVGKTFDQIAMDDSKDVFVKFYAPWCGHCKKLAPVWDELGEAYKDNSNIVIAKFDATANEAEGVNVRGYPTLIFYPKGDKKNPVNYDGERDLEGFKKWLSENAPTLKGDAGSSEAVKEDL